MTVATAAPAADGGDPRKARLLKNPGRRSAPSAGGVSWWALSSADLDNAALFTRYDIPRMLRDPRVRFGIRVLTSPLPKVRIRVRAESAAVRVFVEGQMRKWWRLAAVRLARQHLVWGAAAAVLEFAPDRRRVRLGAARVFAPHEVAPRVFAGRRGRFAGITLGDAWVPAPHAVWYAGEAEAGPLWDTPRLAGAFDPWLEKNGRGGARHSRRLWYRKNAFSGGAIYHPVGSGNLGTAAKPDVQDYRDVARAQLEYIENGAGLTFPNTTDPSGKRVWEYVPPESRPDVAGMADYPAVLDAEIDVGLGIPPEVVEAAETGSGWSGRAVPLLSFLGSADEMAALLIECAAAGFLRELVAANFGCGAWWEAENVPLEETLARPSPGVGQPQSQQPADDPQPRPGGRGWTDPATGKHTYGDLAHDPAADPLTPQEHRLLALAMVRARLDAGDGDAGDVLDGLAELAADPAAVRRLLDPAADLGWEAYQGPRGGRGWRDTDTGRVRYQQARPFDRRDRSHADGREAVRLAEHIANGAATTAHVQSFSDHVVRLNRDQLALAARQLGQGFGSKVRRDAMVESLLAHVRAKGDGDGGTERPGDGDRPAPGTGGRVAGAAERPAPEGADRGRGGEHRPAGDGPAGRVPAPVERVHRNLDRYAAFFRGRGHDQLASWVDRLRGHVDRFGVAAAVDSLGEDRGDGDGAAYEGWWAELDGDDQPTGRPDMDRLAKFASGYLARHGITLHGSSPRRKGVPLVSSSSPSQGGTQGRTPGSFRPADPTLKDKLAEAKALPGLEASEDISTLAGKPVTHLTPEVTKKLDDTYGLGRWIVKAYGDDAAAGYGIFFPQRAEQLRRDAQAAIWDSGRDLARYSFRHLRDDAGRLVGIEHEGGDQYRFGTRRYEQTIHGDVRRAGDAAERAAGDEHGAELPGGGKEFMAQPAFEVVGVSDADRAKGVTIKEGQEGRVHIVTRDGKAELVPHSTWLKGHDLPVVFEDEDTRAMAQAAVDAVNALPESERRGQIYAPDVVRAKDGYRVVEANPANSTGSSGYLGNNPFIIDAHVSHLTGRSPAHVRFLRRLLTERRKPLE